ncbi:MAG: TolC family protein [Verrucomicrobiota bacterium]
MKHKMCQASVAVWLALVLGAPVFLGMAQSPDNPPVIGFDQTAYLAGARSNMLLRIGRVDCMAYALQANNEIRIKRISPILRSDEVAVARAEFEPSLNVQANLHDTTERSASLMSSNTALTRTTDFSVDLGGKLPTGTRYNLAFLADALKSGSFFQTINPAYSTEPMITLTQPLLRGAGIVVNRADIIIARNNLVISKKAFEETTMTIISRTLTAYYGLFYARVRHAIEMEALDRAYELLKINQKRYAKGLISSVDLLETETAAAERQKNVIAAEAAMKNAEDALKLVTNLVDDPVLWNARVFLIDEPELSIQHVDLVRSLERAFEYRPDYQALKIALASRDIQIKVARNALLPTVDLIGSFGLNGLGDSFQDALGRIGMDYKDWMVGAKLTVPWGGAERAKLDKSKWEKIQSLLEIKRLEQNIVFEIRNCVREVDIQFRQTDASWLASEMETENYDAQQERYAYGQVSTHDLLDYQNRLASSRLDYVKALIDYQIALIRLDHSEGVILAKNNITLEN